MSSPYQYIDPSELLSALDNDFPFFQQLSETFLEVASASMNNLQQAIVAKDCKAIGFESHFLKGSALQVGASELGQRLNDIEMLALAQNVGQIAPLWESVVALYKCVEAEVQDSIRRLPHSSAA